MKPFLAIGLALLTCGCNAQAATLKATPATLQAVLRVAGAGDTISLAPGEYGNVGVDHRKSPITFVSANPGVPAVLRTLDIEGSTGVTFDNVVLNFTPDAKSVSWSCAASITDSQNISIVRSHISGGPAVAGVEMTAKATDNSGNVIGLPTGRGLCVTGSQDVTISDNEISKFHRGILLLRVSRVKIQKNNIHDMRTTAIVGADLTDVTIQDNYLHDANPWRWGQTPVGDHADMLALWSNSNQTTPNARVSVIGNRFEQANGMDILGMWFEGSEKAPFTDAVISNNVFLLANLQGILLWHTHGARVDNNMMRRVGDNPKQSPGILLRAGVTGVTMSGNTLNMIDDQSDGKNAKEHNKLTDKKISPEEAKALKAQ